MEDVVAVLTSNACWVRCYRMFNFGQTGALGFAALIYRFSLEDRQMEKHFDIIHQRSSRTKLLKCIQIIKSISKKTLINPTLYCRK